MANASPWIFERDAQQHAAWSSLRAGDRAIADAYRTDGFVVLDHVNFCDGIDVDGIWPTLMHEYETGKNRVQDAWLSVAAVREIACHPEILRVLGVLYGREAIPFQTLNFLHGTEQATHSDTIHFTSLPAGFMCGVWIAMEDITLRQGPLHYYPGSHVLPSLTYADLGIPAVTPPFDQSNPAVPASYGLYERKIAAVAGESGFAKVDLAIKRGSALIWSANLLHGGSPRDDRSLTRKSQVTHYLFAGTLGVTPMFSDRDAGIYCVRDVRDIRSARVIEHHRARPEVVLEPRGTGLYRVHEPGVLAASGMRAAIRAARRAAAVVRRIRR